MFFGFAKENTDKTNFFWKLPMEFIASSLHRFYALIFVFFKALKQWKQIQEAMKR
jgi:succinate dehydrogenase/fumarate reductase cytochrome b subunit